MYSTSSDDYATIYRHYYVFAGIISTRILTKAPNARVDTFQRFSQGKFFYQNKQLADALHLEIHISQKKSETKN